MPKFLHAADLHVDSPLRNLEVFGATVAERLRAASRKALDNLVQLALAEQVAFVVFAGDLFDNAIPSVDATLHLASQLRRLTTAGVRVYVLRGNHDYDSREGRRLWPAGVHEFAADAPQTFVVPDHAVALHGQSYPTKAVTYDMTPRYPAAVPGHLNIGVLHTALEGHAGEHARYAQTTPATLANKGYAYWALGHVHDFTTLELDGTRIVYPGNLQGRHIRETGPKGAAIVTWEGTSVVEVRHVPCDVLRWHLVRVELPRGSLLEQLDAIGTTVAKKTADDRAARRDCALRLELAGLDAELAALSTSALRDRVAEAINNRIGDDVLIEDIHVVDTSRVELPGVLKEHVKRAIAKVEAGVAAGGAGNARPRDEGDAPEQLVTFTNGLWRQLDALGPEVLDRIREHLGIKDESDLRARLLTLGAQRLAARISEER